MKTIILVRGVPGSGKTSFANLILEGLRAMRDAYVIDVSADEYMYTDRGKFDPSYLGTAHRKCRQAVDTAFKSAVDYLDTYVIAHNTLTTEKELKEYYDIAEKHDAKVISLIMENRHGSKSVHDAPENTIRKMVDRFSIKLAP